MTLPFQLPHRWFLYLLALFILLLSVLTVVGERGGLHLWRLRGEKGELDEQNYRLQKENEGLRQRIHWLRHDDFYLEKIAREELNLVRPGEVIYRFSPSEGRNNRAAGLTARPSESRPSAARKPPR